MLSSNTIALVKSTIPLLSQAGTAVTAHFYDRMFTHNPELKDIFNMSNQQSGKQHFALFNALAAYATHIDNLPVLAAAVERINHKHASLNILPHHYDIVGLHLIETLKELAPNEFTPDIEQAWREAYALLADVFITQEEGIYKTTEEKLGGWRNTRTFIVDSIVQESAKVKSFYLRSADSKAVVDFQPGQYIGVHVKPVECQNVQIRQYSLSGEKQPNGYRISVKQQGLVSNHMHSLKAGDEVELSPPAGDFMLQSNMSPKVLISAGVGITPMMAMLESIATLTQPPQTHFVHACINQAEHSFAKRVDTLTTDRIEINADIWYEQGEGHHQGRIDLAQLSLPTESGEFYLCGPTPFMAAMKQQLLALNVAPERILYEVFGPHESL
ncbi:NO-inducible flavohemoprotein [Pseudoalteromonas sp. MMG005]|uniref:NO-inducible flavohemoprotein n=1 Tax=Pseudoalteromonas sp. MMG005 TaxID=2822682 RepID=UPI001B3A4679|nr:NO-inducible flavohemoprotein [Pseudoalteromonas sp. MMG005]MBQ4844649.1 NO-inducible flavohemoprotein [Pseudoalteromonas sp. MMG005]